MEILLAVGTGIGLASVAGVRAYVPVVLAGVFAVLGLFGIPAAFGVLDDGVVIGILVALAVLEGVLDKVSSFESVVNWVQTPVRMVAGAVLFSSALGAGLGADAVPYLVAGAVIAGAVSILKILWRPPASVQSAGVSASFLSASEDVLALVGGVVAVFVPLVSLLLVAFLLFFYLRIRKRRGRKYGGLRILGD